MHYHRDTVLQSTWKNGKAQTGTEYVLFGPITELSHLYKTFFLHIQDLAIGIEWLRLPFHVLSLIRSFLRVLTPVNIDKSICRVVQVAPFFKFFFNSYSLLFFSLRIMFWNQDGVLQQTLRMTDVIFRSTEMKTKNYSLLCATSPGPAKTSTHR